MWEVTCNNEYYSLAHEELFGYLPSWVREYNLGLSTADNLKDHLDQTYGYGLYEFESTIENETLVSPYEEDEDIPWVGKMESEDGTVYFFKYSIVGIPTKEGYFVTRMD
jgi:hypothetical protein